MAGSINRYKALGRGLYGLLGVDDHSKIISRVTQYKKMLPRMLYINTSEEKQKVVCLGCDGVIKEAKRNI